jgi:ADP-heptose:LPS heptosyltransferase
MSKVLFAGPWVGEFGWELFQFQAYVRTLAPQYEKVIVSSRTGHEFLYDDFAHEFVSYDPDGIHAECELLLDHELDPYFTNEIFSKYHANRWLQVWETTRNNPRQWKPTYIQYGDRSKEKMIDIVIHARQARKRGDLQAHRNWSQDYLEDLVASLPTQNIAFIGKSKDCGYVDGFLDLRDLTLQQLSDALDRSKVLIGGSSGPMHFGSLCGIPHIVTFGPVADGGLDNTDRYKTLWNPLNTPVATINSAWAPDKKEILEALGAFHI